MGFCDLAANKTTKNKADREKKKKKKASASVVASLHGGYEIIFNHKGNQQAQRR